MDNSFPGSSTVSTLEDQPPRNQTKQYRQHTPTRTHLRQQTVLHRQRAGKHCQLTFYASVRRERLSHSIPLPPHLLSAVKGSPSPNTTNLNLSTSYPSSTPSLTPNNRGFHSSTANSQYHTSHPSNNTASLEKILLCSPGKRDFSPITTHQSYTGQATVKMEDHKESPILPSIEKNDTSHEQSELLFSSPDKTITRPASPESIVIEAPKWDIMELKGAYDFSDSEWEMDPKASPTTLPQPAYQEEGNAQRVPQRVPFQPQEHRETSPAPVIDGAPRYGYSHHQPIYMTHFTATRTETIPKSTSMHNNRLYVRNTKSLKGYTNCLRREGAGKSLKDQHQERLEKCRIAVNRYRQRQRENIQLLELGLKESTKQNMDLRSQVNSLKSQVFDLKNEMLRHITCHDYLIEMYLDEMLDCMQQAGEDRQIGTPGAADASPWGIGFGFDGEVV